jgi:hypothetical protein
VAVGSKKTHPDVSVGRRSGCIDGKAERVHVDGYEEWGVGFEPLAGIECEKGRNIIIDIHAGVDDGAGRHLEIVVVAPEVHDDGGVGGSGDGRAGGPLAIVNHFPDTDEARGGIGFSASCHQQGQEEDRAQVRTHRRSLLIDRASHPIDARAKIVFCLYSKL